MVVTVGAVLYGSRENVNANTDADSPNNVTVRTYRSAESPPALSCQGARVQPGKRASLQSSARYTQQGKRCSLLAESA